ncbi:MAG: hypothetical protein NVSMB46_08690 [Candidatus Saccharimonadales bacterium]
MIQISTKGIVLTRLNYQEADRILTVLTPDKGKIGLIAKGVRRPKSKLAGGIELFCTNDVSYITSRGELHTLTSSRAIEHFEHIVKDIDHTMMAYEILKKINKITESAAGEEYYTLVERSLYALNDMSLTTEIIDLWFSMQLLDITGHTPNLHTTLENKKLVTTETYDFDITSMCFTSNKTGIFTANHIKVLRLAIASAYPIIVAKIANSKHEITECHHLAKAMLSSSLRI